MSTTRVFDLQKGFCEILGLKWNLKFHYFVITYFNSLYSKFVVEYPEQNFWIRSKIYPSGQNDNNKTDFLEQLIQFHFS